MILVNTKAGCRDRKPKNRLFSNQLRHWIARYKLLSTLTQNINLLFEATPNKTKIQSFRSGRNKNVYTNNNLKNTNVTVSVNL